MSDDIFASIKQGLSEALACSRGDPMSARETTIQVPDDVDVRKIRKQPGLIQPAFAKHFGFAVSALRDWEQGRRRPYSNSIYGLPRLARKKSAVATWDGGVAVIYPVSW